MKRFLAVLLAVVVLFTTVLPKHEAKAEGLTIAMIAGGAYAIASAAGMDFSFVGYDGAGVSQWMQNKINSWLAGRSIAEAFGTEILRLNVGKLLIPSAAVAGITSFLTSLRQEAGITENMQSPVVVASRVINGQNVIPYTTSKPILKASALPYYGDLSEIPTNEAGVVKTISQDGTLAYLSYYGFDHQSVGSDSPSLNYFSPLGWLLMEKSTYDANSIYICNVDESGTVTKKSFSIGSTPTRQGQVSAIVPGLYSPPEGLNDLQSWEGTVANSPDTNLDDLLDDIFDQGAAGTLDVIGEAVDTPELPEATPAPTAAPGDIIGGLDVISGQLEGIDSTLTGVQEGVGEAVGQLEGINEGVGGISEALEVPTTSEAPTFKFDLTTLFPFCIPFDIYRFVTMFSASPVAPHVQIPFNIPAIGLQYTFDLDFSSFDGVASVLRSVELIAFCVGLAILTSKVIRW